MLNFPTPDSLKSLCIEEKEALAQAIREFLMTSVSSTGGHLASNLGVVELTIALHSVLTEQSRIVWDVGHQCYVHKILTGRADAFSTLRKLDGLSGFPKRKESEYDCFDTGHSTTSISAAIGMAVAKRMQDDHSATFVVIGDGALTGGMAYEALNHLGASKENVKIILNDNQMSISKNVGGVVNALRASRGYNKFKKTARSLFEKIPVVGGGLNGWIRSAKKAIRSFFVGDGQLFEELGIKYLGKVDGHSISALQKAIRRLEEYEGPALLHVYTVKGKGYPPAELEPSKYHGVGTFDPEIGVTDSGKVDFSSVFGNQLLSIAERRDDVVAISAAMIDGTGLGEFAERYPGRIFDVGIAEQHAVTFAAGLAVNGLKPYVAIYSTFLQRAYDQVVHDICLQNLPAVFCVDRAGVVGADGETHQGIFDISYLGSVPNLTLISVSNYKELREAMEYAADYDGPIAIRYPRGSEVAPIKGVFYEDFCVQDRNDQEDQSHTDRDRNDTDRTDTDDASMDTKDAGGKIGIFTTGRAVKVASEVRRILNERFGIDIPVYSIVRIKPFTLGVTRLIQRTDAVFTIEDHIVNGGFGDLVRNELKAGAVFEKFGFRDFVPHGSQDELYERYGLCAEEIAGVISWKLNVGGMAVTEAIEK